MKTFTWYAIYLLALIVIPETAHAQTKKPTMKALAQTAISAWEKGESSGDYSDFKSLLATDFNLFSHPLMGRFSGREAKAKMDAIIAEREKLPNALTFSEVMITTGDNYALIAFNSEGTVMDGKYPYQGYNVIGFKLTGGKISGFREYFGFVDPAMFK
jgi:hypothetical protein